MSKDANHSTSAVRLRLPERDQVLWQAQCLDDLLPAGHRARTVWAVVCRLDLSDFHEPIKAREGTDAEETLQRSYSAGRDRRQRRQSQ